MSDFPNVITPVFMTGADLARVLKCSVAAIRYWQRQGLPYTAVGRLRRYELSKTIEWLREREQLKERTKFIASPPHTSRRSVERNESLQKARSPRRPLNKQS